MQLIRSVVGDHDGDLYPRGVLRLSACIAFMPRLGRYGQMMHLIEKDRQERVLPETSLFLESKAVDGTRSWGHTTAECSW